MILSSVNRYLALKNRSASDLSNPDSVWQGRGFMQVLEPRIVFDIAAGFEIEYLANGDMNGTDDSYDQNFLSKVFDASKIDRDRKELIVLDEDLRKKTDFYEKVDQEKYQVIFINQNDNIITRITDYIQNQLENNLSAIHIITHGSEGQIDDIDSNDIENYKDEFKTWQANMPKGYDILLYGCNIAKGREGDLLIQNITKMSGANIAASTNITSGMNNKIGDLKLEATIGQIETEILQIDNMEPLIDINITSDYGQKIIPIDITSIKSDEYDYKITNDTNDISTLAINNIVYKNSTENISGSDLNDIVIIPHGMFGDFRVLVDILKKGTNTVISSHNIDITVKDKPESLQDNLSDKQQFLINTLSKNNLVIVDEKSIENTIDFNDLSMEQGLSDLKFKIKDLTPLKGELFINGLKMQTNDYFYQDNLENLNITFTPNSDFVGITHITLQICDLSGDVKSDDFNFVWQVQQNNTDEPSVISNKPFYFALNNDNNIITSSSLFSYDNDESEIYYVIDEINNIIIEKNGTQLQINDYFTQNDIQNGVIKFKEISNNEIKHVLADFKFKVATDISNITDSYNQHTFNIYILDNLIINNTPMLIANGSTIQIGSDYLETMENSSIQIVDISDIKGSLYQISEDNIIENNTIIQIDDFLNGNIVYQHDSQIADNATFRFKVLYENISSKEYIFNINIDNALPFLDNNNDSITVTNNVTVIDENNLSASGDNDQIIFKLTDVSGLNGQLVLNGNILDNLDTFLQKDINEGNLNYMPNAFFIGDSNIFKFTLIDGLKESTEFEHNIIINTDETAVVEVNETVFINNQDQSGHAISNQYLKVEDPNINFEITNIDDLNGELFLDGNKIGVGDAFLQNDVDSGRIKYNPLHATGTFRSFDFDYNNNSYQFTFYVDIDGVDISVITNPISINFTSSSTPHAITSANMLSSGIFGKTLFYELKDLSNLNGKLYKDNILMLEGSLFTQSDIDNNKITYKSSDDLDFNNPGDASFVFRVFDDEGNAKENNIFDINLVQSVNDAVNLTNNLATVPEDLDILITNSLLSATDTESTAENIIYTVTNIDNLNGILNKGEDAMLIYETFSQKDIDDGKIKYTPNADYNGSASFKFKVEDEGGLAIEDQTFNIVVESVNDDINLTNNLATVPEDLDILITNSLLSATDTESTAENIIYTVTNIDNLNGILKKDEVALGINETFSQKDIDDGMIRYVPISNYNGSASFQFNVEDANGLKTDDKIFNIKIEKNIKDDLVINEELNPIKDIMQEDTEDEEDFSIINNNVVYKIVDFKNEENKDTLSLDKRQNIQSVEYVDMEKGNQNVKTDELDPNINQMLLAQKSEQDQILKKSARVIKIITPISTQFKMDLAFKLFEDVKINKIKYEAPKEEKKQEQYDFYERGLAEENEGVDYKIEEEIK